MNQCLLGKCKHRLAVSIITLCRGNKAPSYLEIDRSDMQGSRSPLSYNKRPSEMYCAKSVQDVDAKEGSLRTSWRQAARLRNPSRMLRLYSVYIFNFGILKAQGDTGELLV